MLLYQVFCYMSCQLVNEQYKTKQIDGENGLLYQVFCYYISNLVILSFRCMTFAPETIPPTTNVNVTPNLNPDSRPTQL